MGWEKRLDRALENAVVLPLGRHTRYILMSDCHRGTGMSYDNFLKNQHLYFAALQYYERHGFCYIELGDGEELWENRCRERILECHSDVYWMFSKLERSCRLVRLYGNHDHDLQNILPEAVRLQTVDGHITVCLMHGHQADLWNSVLWQITRFLVRYLWRPLEQFGVHDPTSAAANYKRSGKIEKRIEKWAEKRGVLLITGHTHRPRMEEGIYAPGQPEENSAPGRRGMYLNTGSCVHPRCITGIEVEGMKLYLVKWMMELGPDMILRVCREVLAGPLQIAQE